MDRSQDAPDPHRAGASAPRAAERRADEAFARFSRSGHPDDLAVVFEYAAPRLLLVAARLAPRHAEDLVQQVFLEAIRAAERFEPGRPVLPWLTVILARRASNLRRRAEPAHLEEGDAPRSRVPDPGDAAALADVTAQIAAAVRDLPAPYREVLHLRIVHGLRPVEIAAALDRKLAVVNSQLHRGLRRLRARLPAGIGAACLTAFGGGAGLTGVAARVRRAARAARADVPTLADAPTLAAPATTALIESLTVKKTVAALVVAALAVPGLWQLLDPAPDAGPPTAPRSTAPGTVVDAAVEESSAAAAEPRASVGRKSSASAERSAVGVGAPAEDRVVLRGRCVGPDGVGVSGAEVEVRLFGATAAEPSRARAGADGRFAVDVAAQDGFPAQALLSVTVGAAGAPQVVGFLSVRAGRAPDLGDVPIVPGAAVRGVVRGLTSLGGSDGSPAASVRLERQGTLDVALPNGLTLPTAAVAEPAVDGTFETTAVLPHGSYTVHVDGHEVLAPPMPVAVDAESGPLVLSVRPLADRVIEGVVVDERGRPLPARVVRASNLLFAAAVDSAAPADGRFTVHRRGDEDDDPVELLARMDGYEPARQRLEWGTRDARIVLTRRGVVRISVVGEDSGEPVTHFGLRVLEAAGGTQGTAPLGQVAEHEGGTLVTDLLAGTSATLQVEPGPETGYAASAPTAVDLSGDREIVLVVPPVASCRVQVVDATGAPVPGAEVLLVELPDGDELTPGTTFELQGRGRPGARPVARDRRITSADGTVVVAGSPHAVHGLRIERDGFARTVVGRVALGSTASTTVELAAGATVHGRVTRRGDEPAQGDVHLRSTIGGPDAERLPRERSAAGPNGVPFASDRLGVPLRGGVFEIVDVPSGDWELVLVRSRPGSLFPESVVIATVLGLRPGERRALDASIGGDVEVVGRVVVDGEPLAGGKILFEDTDPRRPSRSVALGADGDFSAALPESRRFLARLKLPDGRWLTAPDEVVTGANDEQRWDLDLETAEVRLRLLDPDGRPVDGLVVYPAGALGGVRTDADGRVTLRAAAGRQRFCVRPRSLLDDADWRSYLRRTVGELDRFERVLVPLPELRVSAEEAGEERTVRLPVEWASR